MRIFAAAAVMLAIAACGRSEAPAAAPAPAEPSAVVEIEEVGEPVTMEEMRERSLAEIDRAACEREGGEVRQEGILGLYRCVLPYKDAGKACRSSADCEGKCLAGDNLALGATAEGQCQATDSPFGCFAEIEDGKVAAAICVD